MIPSNHPTTSELSTQKAGQAAWPAARDTMHRRARQLLEAGATDEGVMQALCEEFPGLLLKSGNEWRRDAIYQNVIEAEKMAFQKRRGRAPAVGVNDGGMSPGLIAFAEARGLVCAYCGRPGTRLADADGLSWFRDSVPRGFQQHGRDLELACTVCRADNERYRRLGGDVDAV